MKVPAVLMLTVLVLAGCQDSSSPSQTNSSTESTTEPDSTTGGELATAENDTDSGAADQVSVAESTTESDSTTSAVLATAENETETEPAAPESVVDSGILAPGSEAREVAVKVIHGAPFESIQKGRVYVVEFWATWCGPCLQSMPHISTLQEEYGDAVQFIGVTDEDAETVAGFMQQTSPSGKTWSDVLGYTIALDDDSATWENYMKAADQGGIPCAFIVEQSGKVAWIGHPMNIDEPLARVVNGDFDVEAAAKSFETEKQLQPALRGGDFEQALEILNILLESDPSSLQYGMMKMQVLGILSRPAEIVTWTTGLVEDHAENAGLQNEIAWFLCNQEGMTAEGLELAFQAANAANQITDGSEPFVLHTMARVHYRKRDLEAAVEWQKKAAALDVENERIQQTLEEYQAELAEQSSNSATESDADENSDGEEQAVDSGA
ncbi:MAG: TlpA family protein disulfide reductase [Fuerstiella sp.]|nr:TlpA family protein disulfide reductase [Fuerstiella sp.]